MKNRISTILCLALFSVSLNAQNTVSGTINCLDGNPIAIDGVTIELIAASGTVQTTSPDGNGEYEFLNVASNEDYTLHIEADDPAIYGITTYDLVLIVQGILNPPFDNPFLILAADVNLSGSVSTLDLVLLRQLILFIVTDLPGPTWRFATEDFDYDPPSGFVNDIPIVDLQSDIVINLVAVKVGDVSGNACN
ncbi:MAG: hypothetical protein GY951_03900 [Psychromonas sp.]|nr:hypothetical protein [Psychromonas sp.]